ncbi:MAG: hypothetical protein WCL32_19060 [Planctomycetota bacterium]
MISLRRQHRWFGMGFLLAWALSQSAVVNAQNEPARSSPAEKIRRTLDQVIALDYQGNSFGEAINHLKDRTQLPIQLDQVALQQMGLVDGIPVNIELRNVRGKVRTALQNLLANHNLTYVILEDSLVITSEEAAIARQMRQRVALDLNEVPANKALRDLAKQVGVSLVLDPRVNKIAAQPVSLQLEETSVETGLRLVAELIDLKAVRIGNVILVTDAARAERIRREENELRHGAVGMPMIIDQVIRGGGGNAVPGVAPPQVEPKIE